MSRDGRNITCVLLNPTIDRVYEVDEFEVGGTYKAKHPRIFPVGKAISVALALRTLGREPRVIALVGEGEVSLYQDFLMKHHIPCTLTPVDGKTRSNTTIIDSIRQTVTHVREPGFLASANQLDGIKRALKILRQEENDFVVFSGSTPPGLKEDTYHQLISLCWDLGFHPFIDTSGIGLKNALKEPKPFILKLNKIELEYLLDKRESDREVKVDAIELSPDELDKIIEDARSLIGDTLKIVAVTLGKNGALIATKDQAYHGKITVERPLNTVGAGDAFSAGLIHALVDKNSLRAALSKALACAAASTMEHGAGLFRIEDYEALLSRADPSIL